MSGIAQGAPHSPGPTRTHSAVSSPSYPGSQFRVCSARRDPKRHSQNKSQWDHHNVKSEYSWSNLRSPTQSPCGSSFTGQVRSHAELRLRVADSGWGPVRGSRLENHVKKCLLRFRDLGGVWCGFGRAGSRGVNRACPGRRGTFRNARGDDETSIRDVESGVEATVPTPAGSQIPKWYPHVRKCRTEIANSAFSEF